MLNIDYSTIEIACPKCQFITPVSIRQIRLRDVVICRGCKRNLQLEDHLNSVRAAQRSISHALQDLEDALGSRTIEIKL